MFFVYGFDMVSWMCSPPPPTASKGKTRGRMAMRIITAEGSDGEDSDRSPNANIYSIYAHISSIYIVCGFDTVSWMCSPPPPKARQEERLSKARKKMAMRIITADGSDGEEHIEGEVIVPSAEEFANQPHQDDAGQPSPEISFLAAPPIPPSDSKPNSLSPEERYVFEHRNYDWVFYVHI